MIKAVWNRILNDKILFAIFVFVCVVVAFDVFVLVFDVVQFIMVSSNRALYSKAFVAINVIASILNLIAVAACVLYVVLRKK